MFRTLLKKELMEIFRTYFYDSKKNKGRSRVRTIVGLIGFAAIMTVLMGGMFGLMAFQLCPGLAEAGVGWLYFTIMGILSVVLGVFGSVFSTYSSLYLAKDNDLLLSMPIPVGYIMASRLAGVYLMGLMFSASVLVPAAVVYQIVAGPDAAAAAGSLVLLLVVSIVVLVLSCLLGWVVARLSLKLKNRSLFTVLIALACIGLYYFLYFRAMDLMRDLVNNAVLYGEKIQGAAYGLYVFGSVGEGRGIPMLLCLAAAAVLLAASWWILHRSFLKITTSTGAVKKAEYREKTARQKSPEGALFGKELARFLSSPNVILNCGLGTLIIPACGILLLWKGKTAVEVLCEVFGNAGAAAALLAAALCMAATMNDMAAPSVSLEGKNLWLLRVLPVTAGQILWSKLKLQLLLTTVPMIFCAACGAAVLPLGAGGRLLFAAVCVLYTVMMACFDLLLSLKMPNLQWSNETVLVKQSACVFLALMVGWVYAAAIAALYLWKGHLIGISAYLGACLAVTAVILAALAVWLAGRGTKVFEKL